MNCILRVLFLADRSDTRCGLLLLEPICFRVRRVVRSDGILYTLVVTSGYLSYCYLSIISNQSVHSPLTSDINEALFVHTTAARWIFSLFEPFSVNTRDGCAVKIPVDQQCVKYSDQSVWHQQPFHVQVT